ncbi:MAG: stage IV sporulation protein A [Zhaonellaceae bacterium]|jgi:stage IV sporulation protein A|nr:stage IV sporulation protein A [Clostridia bacterium]
MQNHDIFRDIAERTGGDIYLGFVGPVRTGKSTLIKRIMDLLVIPNIKNPNERDRAKDELPQSGAGRTITTSEPKFIPNEAVEVTVKEGIKLKVRMVDCVGYRVEGALGYDEDGGPRMVRTPWFEEAIPFQEAAEVGTRKVITDHSTIGIAVFTDGTITDIPRENYLDAEERVIYELKEINKPFVIVLNSLYPEREDTIQLAESLEELYNAPVLPLDCANLSLENILNIFEEALYEFPVTEVNVNLPKWIEALDNNHWLRMELEEAVRNAVDEVARLRDIDNVIETLSTYENIERTTLKHVDLGKGSTTIEMTSKEGLFYKILEELTGYKIDGDDTILKLMQELSMIKKDYDKIEYGLQEVRNTGFGMVLPSIDEMVLEEPELIKQGRGFGVKLKATAPSYHFIKANISTEITPLIGTEKQCEDLVKYIMEEFEENPQKIWDTNIFGKSLSDLVREGIQGKLYHMPESAQQKLQETLERIVNEGSGGLICIII